MMVDEKLDYTQLVQHVYNAFNSHNANTALEVIHPQAEWANTMEGGLLKGHEEINSYWHRQWSYIDWHVQFVDLTVEDPGTVVVNTHQIIRDLSGNIVTLKDVQQVFRIEDGLIVEMRVRS